MFLFYDTETTGVNPKVDHIVQLAALLTFPDGRKAMAFDMILKCPIPIPPNATAVHGITDEMCAKLGVDPAGALDIFHALLARAQVAVAYNDQFDVGFIQHTSKRVALREGEDYADPFASVQRSCGWQMAQTFLGRKRGTKLIDVHTELLGRGFEGAHDAMNDVVALKDVFFDILAKKRDRIAQAAVAQQAA